MVLMYYEYNELIKYYKPDINKFILRQRNSWPYFLNYDIGLKIPAPSQNFVYERHFPYPRWELGITFWMNSFTKNI